MEKYVLALILCDSCRAVVIPAHSCEPAKEWLTRAREWAIRSGLPGTEPIWVCMRTDALMQVRNEIAQ